ncbi:MAG: CDP-alcohol phosphatidyltransferase family protein [Actinobacteria bacterium]|nr:CDP-alcohol phosphatidyltransferase family protein [Actinomycetota bacterium]MBV9253952.1 CDP-alcohol phosphatidyltransferase family protein [Actinomycetota bacterium]MBV9664593.1 CDP-alcohol phosphatidyltransferase family protein [Actinomycetota bacterium]MBV9933976.1 CDP-alcohol phosphatidyltransferase family protein [Actinomycetota bacterium]
MEEPNEGKTQGEDRLLTVPNLLSVGRLLCVPLFLYLLFGRDNRAGAAWLLAGLGATDWVDGYVARHFNQVSTLGKILDPLADRILLGVGVIALLIDGSVPTWVGVAALAREVVVAIAALVLASLGARRIDVTWVGKAGTFGLMFAFPMFLASHSTLSVRNEFGVAAWLCAIPGLILSYYAAATYVPIAKRALEEGRVGSER